ncbi:MAG: ParB/RepB/Spo0J family partition protein [Acidobacteria bacterium]|nr:ParB/RepB/Spo0J family partition protein [Acidobacteriota bacterium]
MAKKRLGIDALFATTAVPDADAVAVRRLLLETIIPNPNQPRRRLDASALNALVESIKQSGVLQPIIVREIKSNNLTSLTNSARYEIVAGERRWQAARLAGLLDIPTIVRSLSDEEALQLALIENLQREDLNPIEETEGYLALLKLKLTGEDGFLSFARANDEDPYGDVLRLLFAMNNHRTAQKVDSENKVSRSRVNNNVVINLSLIVETVFSAIGKTNWLSFIQHRLPLRRLPNDILEALREGKLEYTKARLISRLTNQTLACTENQAKEIRKSILEQTIIKSLSLGAIRRLIQEKINQLQEEQTPKINQKVSSPELQALTANTLKQLKKIRLETLSDEQQQQLKEKLSELSQLVEFVTMNK